MTITRSIFRLRPVVLVVVLAVLAIAGWWYHNASAFRFIDITGAQFFTRDDSRLVAELLDHRNAAILLPREAFSKQISVPVSAVDGVVNRRVLLASLFSRLTAGQPTDQLRVEAWVRYVQDRIAHPKWAPLLENGQAIYDPYWILKNQLGQCGQTNRLVVDGLAAAGFKARVVQLKSHVAAEVWLDGAWRYLDADWLNLGQFVRHEDGSLASAKEIHENRKLLNGLLPGLEFRLYPVDVLHPGFEPYDEMFSVRPYYLVKTATAAQEKNEYYGWNYYQIVRQ